MSRYNIDTIYISFSNYKGRQKRRRAISTEENENDVRKKPNLRGSREGSTCVEVCKYVATCIAFLHVVYSVCHDFIVVIAWQPKVK